MAADNSTIEYLWCQKLPENQVTTEFIKLWRTPILMSQ